MYIILNVILLGFISFSYLALINMAIITDLLVIVVMTVSLW